MRSVRPKKQLGQHFLTDMTIASNIADTVDGMPQLPILEVGPGMGALTEFLLKKGRKLRVVEIDDESVRYLQTHFPSLKNDIIEKDFIGLPLDEVFGGEAFVLTGNYPYNISSQIFFHMLDYHDLVPLCTGMLQKEVAERLASPPGRKAYGILSVFLQAWYDVELLFTVEPAVFCPPPKVMSAVVRMTRNSRRALECDQQLFRKVVKATFNQRRKMLRVSLRQLFAMLDAQARQNNKPVPDHSQFLSANDLTRRPEQLSVDDFQELTRKISAHYNTT